MQSPEIPCSSAMRGVRPSSAIKGVSKKESNCQPSLVPRHSDNNCSNGQMPGSNCQRGSLKPRRRSETAMQRPALIQALIVLPLVPASSDHGCYQPSARYDRPRRDGRSGCVCRYPSPRFHRARVTGGRRGDGAPRGFMAVSDRGPCHGCAGVCAATAGERTNADLRQHEPCATAPGEAAANRPRQEERLPRGRREAMDEFSRQVTGSTRYSFSSIEAGLADTPAKPTELP